MSNANFKLYYTATSCGAANFIAATVAELKFDSEQVDLATHKTQSGADYYTINPKGNVPTIVTESGDILNENVATLQFIAAQNPKAALMPAVGTIEHYKFLNVLSWVATELHKTVGALFSPAWDEATVKIFHAACAKKFEFLEKTLLADGKNKFLTGDKVTVADFYAYIVLTWLGYLKVQSTKAVDEYVARVRAVPGVAAAHEKMNAAAAKKA